MKKNSEIVWAGCVAGLIVLTGYFWLFTLGKWTIPATSTDIYSQLAAGFLKGHLYVDEQPSPELLALPDPYNPKARKEIDFPLDVSLYNGKFYYYWGPVPALFAALGQSVFRVALPDNLFVLAFVTGSFIFRSCILALLWQRFLRGLPAWAFGLGILAAGLMGVSTWMLHLPSVYQAATTGGEFFLVGGLFFAFSAILNRVTIWKFLLAGLFWAGAIGTRLTQALPIAFMLLMIVIYLIRQQGTLRTFSKNLLLLPVLGAPIILTLAGLAWYNWARFGSIFEAGIYYQLAGPDLHQIAGAMFSPHYIIQNLYNYFARSYLLLNHAPFFYHETGRLQPIFHFYFLPGYYFVQGSMTGFLSSSPALFFSGMPIFLVLRSALSRGKLSCSYPATAEFSFRWIVISLWGSFAASLLLILMHFWAAERYAADFISPMVLLAILGFWLIYNKRWNGSTWQVLASAAVIAIWTYSLVITSILASLWQQDLFFA